MKPDQTTFHDPRRRRWLGGFFTAAVAAGAGLWILLFLGMCLVMWRMDRRIQDLDADLDRVHGRAEQAEEAALAALTALQAHLDGKPIKIMTMSLRQDDRE